MAKLSIDIAEATPEEIQDSVDEHDLTYENDPNTPYGYIWITVHGDRENIISWLKEWYYEGSPEEADNEIENIEIED